MRKTIATLLLLCITANAELINVGDALKTHSDGIATLENTKLSKISDTSIDQSLVTPKVFDRLILTNNNATALSYGEVAMDTDNRTLSIGLGNGVVGQVFCEGFTPFYNATGSTITNGEVIAFQTTIGNSSKINGVRFIGDGSMNPHKIIGIATEDVLPAQIGFATIRGPVNGLDTDGSPVNETWADYTMIYASTNMPGKITVNKPNAPLPCVCLGWVEKARNNGSIYVKIDWTPKLADLWDVNGTPLTVTGQFPLWDQARGVFDFNYNYITGTNLLWSGVDSKVSTNDTRYLTLVTNNQTAVTLNLVGPNNGFEHQYSQTLAFNPSTRQLTITPTGTVFKVTTFGISYTYTGPLVSTVAPLDSNMYFYFANGGTLIGTNQPWTINGEAQAAYVKYNTNTLSVVMTVDERHGVEWTDSIHRQQHETIGTKWSSGMALYHNSADNATAANANGLNTCISIQNGEMYDEDVEHLTITNGVQDSSLITTNTSGVFPILYRDINGEWVKTNGTPFPFLWSGNIPQVVSNGVFNNVAEDRYFVYWVAAVGSFDSTNLFLIPHPITFTSTALAQSGATPYSLGSVLGALPSTEILVTHRLIFLYNATAGGAHPVSVKYSKLRDVTDFRQLSSGVIVAGLPGASAAIVHNDTTGRDALDTHPMTSITALTETLAGKIDTNLLVVSGSITNQLVVSPVGSNNVAQVWQGTYSNYLALVEKTNSTTYIITDDLTYDVQPIYGEVVSYSSIAPTTTVAISQEKLIYNVAISTNTVINFDMSGLNFSSRIATFELHLATTNISYWFTFASGYSTLTTNNLYWLGGDPDWTKTNQTYYIVMRAFNTNSIHANLQYTR